MWWSCQCVIFTLWVFSLCIVWSFFTLFGCSSSKVPGCMWSLSCLRRGKRGKGEYGWGEEGACIRPQILGSFVHGEFHLCWVKWEVSDARACLHFGPPGPNFCPATFCYPVAEEHALFVESVEGCQLLGNKVCTGWSACLRESWWCVPACAAGDGPHASEVAWTLWIYCASLRQGLSAWKLDVVEAEHL